MTPEEDAHNQSYGRSHPRSRWRLNDAQRRALVASIYYVAVIAALAIDHWFSFKVGASSVIILIALLAPFIVGRLSSFEYGGVKVQLRELKQEVLGATDQISRDVSNTREEINARIEQLAGQSREYLLAQPLAISDQKANEMRRTINISPEEVTRFLASPDPGFRVPAYIQLQVRPDSAFLRNLTDCFFLEGFLADTKGETRPLWQLLVAVKSCAGQAQLNNDDKRRLLMAMRHFLEYLDGETTLDRGGQCKKRLHLLIQELR